MKVNSIEDVERFLSIQEQALGSNNPEVAITLQRLASLYLDNGDLLKAESIYERALGILEVATAPHRAGAAAVGQKLYEISLKKKEKEEAASRRGGTIPPHARRTLQDTPLTLSMGGIPSVDAYLAKMKSTSESYKPSAATSDYEEVGLSHSDLSGKSDKPKKVTESMFLEAQSEITLLRQMVGDHNVSVADALTKLADLYCRKKMYKEMEPLLIEALQIREDTFGGEHHTVSTELKNLARVYMAQERFSVAEPLLKRAINIRTKAYGRNHRRTIDALELYVTLLKKTNRFEKADEIQKRINDPNDTSAISTDTSTDHDAYKFDKVR
jgi:tetratricopeptide (TPR) repeat protein